MKGRQRIDVTNDRKTKSHGMAVLRSATLLAAALLARSPAARASFFCLLSSSDPCSSFGRVQSDSCAADVKALHASVWRR